MSVVLIYSGVPVIPGVSLDILDWLGRRGINRFPMLMHCVITSRRIRFTRKKISSYVGRRFPVQKRGHRSNRPLNQTVRLI